MMTLLRGFFMIHHVLKELCTLWGKNKRINVGGFMILKILPYIIPFKKFWIISIQVVLYSMVFMNSVSDVAGSCVRSERYNQPICGRPFEFYYEMFTSIIVIIEVF